MTAKFTYDVDQRRRQKEKSRADDEVSVPKGVPAAQTAKASNGLFSSLKIVRVDMVEDRITSKRAT